MPNDIRDLLHDRAEEMRLDPRLPRGVAARARRRRTLFAAGGGVLAATLVVGSFAGIRLVAGTGPDLPGTEGPSPSVGEPTAPPSTAPPVDETWAGVWPERTREEAEAAQACADAGDEDCTWRIDARGFLENLAGQAFSEYVDLGVPADLQPEDGGNRITTTLTTCLEGCFGGTTVEVSIERLVRRDDTGIWSVTDVGQVRRFTDAICSNCPVTEDEVRQFVRDFMERRQFEVGAEAYLSAEAFDEYRLQGDDLVLYAHEVDSYGEGFDIGRIRDLGDGSWLVQVTVDRSTDAGDVFSSTREQVLVTQTSEDRPGGYPELIVSFVFAEGVIVD